MPCYDDRTSGGWSDGYAEGVKFQKREGRHNSDVAELLCAAMNRLSPNSRDLLCKSHKELAIWWEEHQERDRRKAEQERKHREDIARQAAFNRELKQLKKKHGVK